MFLARSPLRSRSAADNQTVRNVFVIGPDKKIKLILVYPMSTGRNFNEVLRVIDSLHIISLVRTYGSERVEAASRRGNDIGATTYGSIKSILQNGLDKAYANSLLLELPASFTKPV